MNILIVTCVCMFLASVSVFYMIKLFFFRCVSTECDILILFFFFLFLLRTDFHHIFYRIIKNQVFLGVTDINKCIFYTGNTSFDVSCLCRIKTGNTPS